MNTERFITIVKEEQRTHPRDTEYERWVTCDNILRSIAGEAAQPQPIVWAGDNPFTGAQVLELLNENERLRLAVSTPPARCPTCNQPVLPLNAGSCGCAAALSPAQAAPPDGYPCRNPVNLLGDPADKCSRCGALMSEHRYAVPEPSAQAVAGEPLYSFNPVTPNLSYRQPGKTQTPLSQVKGELLNTSAAPEPVAEPQSQLKILRRNIGRLIESLNGHGCIDETVCAISGTEHYDNCPLAIAADLKNAMGER